jgi:catechol 2,3-dioxygenase-like lactoylglutathione lyase family enzyme
MRRWPRPISSASSTTTRASSVEHRCQGEGPRDPGDQARARGDRARTRRAAGRRAARLPGRTRKRSRRAVGATKAGIKSERRSGITPGIAQAIVFTDPKGTSVEIFSDYTFAKDDDNYTGVMPRKLGHVAFHTPDVAATVKFYCDVLGFKVSDWRSDFFAFLRCSRDHHTINLLQADNANIHHLAFELRDEAEINRACDFLARKNVKLFWGPIRHLIGHNIAIYHKNPDGITVEFFTDIDLMFDEELGYFELRPWH